MFPSEEQEINGVKALVPKILGVDPGTFFSAWFVYDLESKIFLGFGKEENQTFLSRLIAIDADILVYEQMSSYGTPVGSTTFETCVWTGRFIQRWADTHGSIGTFEPMLRSKVKSHLCPKQRSNDSTIREALIERFGKPGSKRKPGPTFGITSDMWSAMAIAVTKADELDVIEGRYVQ